MSRRLRHYYVNRLDTWAALRIAGLQVACGWRPAALIYLEPAPGLAARFVVLRRVFRVREFVHCRDEIGDFRDDDGVNLFWFKDRVMFRVAIRLLDGVDLAALARRLGDRYPVRTLQLFLDRAINHELYVELGRYCMLVALARAPEGGGNAVVLIRRSVFAAAIRVELMDGTPGIAAATFFGPVHPWWPLREVAALVYNVLRAALHAWRNRRRAGPPAPARRLAVALDHMLAREIAQTGTIPWLGACSIARDDILVYDEGTKADPETLPLIRRRLAELGIEYVVYTAWLPAARARTYLRALAVGLAGLVRLSLAPGVAGIRLRYWLVGWTANFVRGTERLTAFVEEYGVAIHQHSGDAEPLLIGKIWAVEGRGGIDAGWQFSGSGEDLPMNFRPMPEHLFFCWGRAHAEIMQRSDELCRGKAPNVFFLGGHVMQHIRNRNQDIVRTRVNELRESGASLIIALFDTCPSLDTFISRRSIEEFYRGVFQKAVLDDRIGIIVKQHSDNIEELDLGDDIANLTRRRRIAFLPARIRPFQIFPCVDLAISMSVRNSAGMEAAIADCPHIYFDTTAWGCHPFYELLPDGMIATDAQQLHRLIEDHIAGKGPSSAGAQWRGYLDWLDPFRDARGHVRFGRFLTDLMEALDRYGDAATALPHVVARYRRSIGQKNVVCNRWPYSSTMPTEPPGSPLRADTRHSSTVGPSTNLTPVTARNERLPHGT